jgi:hypothetical protein
MNRLFLVGLLAVVFSSCSWPASPEARVIDFEPNRGDPVVSEVMVSYYFEAREPEPEEVLARCLTDRGAVLYSTVWCGPCLRQKALFGPHAHLLNIVDCDEQMEKCRDDNIVAVPTWAFRDGSRRTGPMTLRQLARRTRCPYPNR